MVPSVNLTRKGETFEDPKRNRRLFGKMNYLIITCPDIAHSDNVVSQYISAPTLDHWVAIKHILCYLKRASGRGILYCNHGYNIIECFTYADLAGLKEDRSEGLFSNRV